MGEPPLINIVWVSIPESQVDADKHCILLYNKLWTMDKADNWITEIIKVIPLSQPSCEGLLRR